MVSIVNDILSQISENQKMVLSNFIHLLNTISIVIYQEPLKLKNIVYSNHNTIFQLYVY